MVNSVSKQVVRIFISFMWSLYYVLLSLLLVFHIFVGLFDCVVTKQRSFSKNTIYQLGNQIVVSHRLCSPCKI